jgi:hypothetical protein
VQDDRGLAVGPAAGLPVHALAIADVEHAELVRLDRGKRLHDRPSYDRLHSSCDARVTIDPRTDIGHVHLKVADLDGALEWRALAENVSPRRGTR